ncbi:MAG: cyclic nucleotide-binding domain-containing protein [Kofleriaceae bacterium]
MELVDSSLQTIRSAPLGLDADTAAVVLPYLRDQTLAPGEMLFRQGDEVDRMYFVASGKLEICLDETGALVLETIGANGIVGEVAMLVGGRRTASARAAEPTRVLGLARGDLERLFTDHPRLSGAVSRAVHDRLRRTKLATHLTALFGKVGESTLRELEERVSWVQLRGGDELFRQGAAADGAYIVALGRLRVAVTEPDGSERVIDHLGPGEWVGEMALLTRKERSATVYAVRDTELVWLPQAVFDNLMLRHPGALLEASRALVLRLQRQIASTGGERQRAARCFALVPTQPGLDLTPFLEELSASLARFGSVCVLDAARVDAQLEKPGIAHARQRDAAHLRLMPWLLRQEQDHDFVLYRADASRTEWTDRVLRHADEVVFVGEGQGPPELSEVEVRVLAHGLHSRKPRQRLVLLQRPGSKTFPGTSIWLDRRNVETVHHVRRGVREDLERLARLLTCNGIGVVFGGGGSRGYAHLGVVRALTELGIPIDVVAGSSIGAMVASSIGMGLGADEMLDFMPPLLRAAFTDPTLPFVSLMRGHNVLRGARDAVGDLDLEDLLIPTAIVTTNLTRGEPCVLRRGSVALGIRASSSIPGIFPPVPWQGDLLVDGGLSNNVPVDVVASKFGGKVIAVDVIPEVELSADGATGATQSGWSAAWRRINPMHRHAVPNIVTVLMRTVTTGSRGLRNSADCSLLLRPAVSRWNMIDFGAAEPIAEEGYRGTIDAIRAWWAANAPTSHTNGTRSNGTLSR